jgi:hypothetical protein
LEADATRMCTLLVGLPDVTVIAPASGQQPQRGLQIRPSLMMKPCGEAASVAAFTSGCDVAVTAAAGLASATTATPTVSEAAANPPATMVRNMF